MGDPVSLAAGCLAFSLASLQATKLVFHWIDGIKNIDEEMECFRLEMQGLDSVLSTVNASFDEIDDEAIEQNGPRAIYHFQTVHQVMEDCKKCLERLNACLAPISSPEQASKGLTRKLTFHNFKKKVVLDFKSDRTLLLRRQLQSYKDVLNIHIGLINLGGRKTMTTSVEKTAIYVLERDISSTQKKLNTRLAKTVIVSEGGMQDLAEDAYARMESCVRSVKSIISDGSATVVNDAGEGSLISFSLSKDKRKDVETWLRPDRRQSTAGSMQSTWAPAPSEFGESTWQDQSPSISGYQPSEPDHFKRLGILRGASPMSRISEEQSVIHPSPLTVHLSHRNPYRDAAHTEQLAPGLKKSKSERTSRQTPPSIQDFLSPDQPQRAASFHRAPNAVSHDSGFGNDEEDFTPAAPLPRRQFSFADRLSDQVSEWELESNYGAQPNAGRRGHAPSRSDATAEEAARLYHTQSLHRRDLSMPMLETPSQSHDVVANEPTTRRIPSFRKKKVAEDNSVSGQEISHVDEIVQPNLPVIAVTTPAAHATQLDLRIYELHKSSGRIQTTPSGRAGASRSEVLLAKLIQQLGTSAPADIIIEMKKLLVIMYKKQQKFDLAENTLKDLEKLLPEDQKDDIKLDQIYVKAEAEHQRGKLKSAEELARMVADRSLLTTDQSKKMSPFFEDSVMLIITIAEKQNDSANARVHEGLLPVDFRRLRQLRDLCDEIDDQLDESKTRRIDKIIQRIIHCCGIEPTEKKLRAIQFQVRYAKSIAAGGKGIASSSLPVFSLPHFFAEHNRAAELEILYRCADAGPETRKPQALEKKGLDRETNTPLHLACRAGCYEAAKVLLKRKADVNATNSFGQTALHLSLAKNHQRLIFELIEAGADCGIVDSSSESPMSIALLSKDQQIIDLMNSKIKVEPEPTMIFELPAIETATRSPPLSVQPKPVISTQEPEAALELPLDTTQSPVSPTESITPSFLLPEPNDNENVNRLSRASSGPLPATNPFSPDFYPVPTIVRHHDTNSDAFDMPANERSDIPLARSSTNPFLRRQVSPF